MCQQWGTERFESYIVRYHTLYSRYHVKDKRQLIGYKFYKEHTETLLRSKLVPILNLNLKPETLCEFL